MEFILIAALLPAIVLMVYIYRKDRVDKEPMGLLLSLALRGAIAGLPAALLETFGEQLIARYVDPEYEPVRYAALNCFLVVALAEEGCKYVMMRLKTWRNPEFNCTFDGMVYAVFTSLGFAGIENVLYAFNFGPEVLGSRAIFSIPGHMTFGVFMGLYYSRAKKADCYGRSDERSVNHVLSLAVPILLHGFYDFCLLSGLESLSLIFFVFVVALDIASLAVIKKESLRDEPIQQWYSF